MKVLLVTNAIDLSVALQILLREEPAFVVVASVSSVSAALWVIESDCPDLVVLDWDLPGQSASDMLKKAMSFSCSPRVIAMAKHEGDEKVVLDTGAEGFVVKGTSPKNLITAIRNICESEQGNLVLITKEKNSND